MRKTMEHISAHSQSYEINADLAIRKLSASGKAALRES